MSHACRLTEDTRACILRDKLHACRLTDTSHSCMLAHRPPFRVHPQTRAIIPIVQESRRKVKNMPIMFDGPIRGKIDCGERIIEKREARGYHSQVGQK